MTKTIINDVSNLFDGIWTSVFASIAIMSLIAGFLSLGIPIAAQTLINLIAFGQLLQPVFTISIMVFMIMISVGALNVWQYFLIEVVQQKLMVKVGIEFTSQLTHLPFENAPSVNSQDLVNRFFEIVTIQKSLASLILYGTGLSLQFILGLLLLLIYHPYFLIYDLIIIFGIISIVYLPYKKSYFSANQECTEKHIVGSWLEQIVINHLLLRLHQYYKYATYQIDLKLVNFLNARNLHFKQLIKHQVGFYFLSAVSSALLFAIGGYLVVNNQLSIGQLAGAEIILSTFIYSFKRFGALVENYYDLVASKYKIDSVLQMKPEVVNEDLTESFSEIDIIKIEFDKKIYDISQQSPTFIHLYDLDKANELSKALLGFSNIDNISVNINGITCSKPHLLALRRFSFLVTEPQFFVGTVYDNLLLNNKHITNKSILEILNQFNLTKKIMSLEKGLKTVIYDWTLLFTHNELIKLMIVRAILLKPILLIISPSMDELSLPDRNTILLELNKIKDTIIIIITQDDEFNNRTISLGHTS